METRQSGGIGFITDNWPLVATKSTLVFIHGSGGSIEFSNINLLWASLIIEELVRNGISDFCIAPGSRSTPLTLAAASHKKANTHVHFDERGLGFLALGLSLYSRKPVVIITTSGTAVANLYPTIIEARQSGIPLIVLSADRPLELIDCGANQAIDQFRIFSHYPVFFAQIPSATTEKRSSAPPENMSKSPKRVPCLALKKADSAAPSMPGVGIWQPSL